MSVEADKVGALGPPTVRSRRAKLALALVWLVAIAAVLTFVVMLWNEGRSLIDGEASGPEAYLIAAALVFGDAIFPVLPGETTLNAACVLAANGELELGLIIVSVSGTCVWVRSRIGNQAAAASAGAG